MRDDSTESQNYAGDPPLDVTVKTQSTENNMLLSIIITLFHSVQGVQVQWFDSPIPYSPAGLIRPSLPLTCSPWGVTMETGNPQREQISVFHLSLLPLYTIQPLKSELSNLLLGIL